MHVLPGNWRGLHPGLGRGPGGHAFQGGPQYPSFTSQQTFTPGVVYQVVAVYDQPDLPIPPRDPYGVPPLPWDDNAGFPNTADNPGWVQFDQPLAVSGYAAGKWVPTTWLGNAVLVAH